MLTTSYLGIHLPHPFLVGASPMSRDLDLVRRLEDAGMAGIVMHSLFEEQASLAGQVGAIPRSVGSWSDQIEGPDEYVEQLWRIKEAVDVPVVGSLNGWTPGGWLSHARLVADAGADALELNIYGGPTEPSVSTAELEEDALAMVETISRTVGIPVAVKLCPSYAGFVRFAHRMAQAGAQGLVLFNRMYEADLDVEAQAVSPTLRLSDPGALPVRLKWLASTSAAVDVSLALSGGVHTALDAIKGVMAGAHAVQLVSALLRHGPEYLAGVRAEFERWITLHEYESLDQLRGCMSRALSTNERGHYISVLQQWQVVH